jgi:hypothetical protein
LQERTNKEKIKQNKNLRPGMVAQTCNDSCLGGSQFEDTSAKMFARLHLSQWLDAMEHYPSSPAT